VSTIATDLVVTSLGFHAEVSQDFYDPTFRHLRSVAGRLVNAKGEVLQNAYASGWASTGAKGVLASTMMNAYGVTDTIIADWKAPVANYQDSTSNLRGQLNLNPVLDDIPEEVQIGLRDGKVTQYEDWKKVDSEELRRGKELGKERERMGWLEAHQFLRGN
jgi:adrenodoxin-NADP+ reductase